MKKTLTLLFALMLGCMTVKAIPAKPGVKRTVTLADDAVLINSSFSFNVKAILQDLLIFIGNGLIF